MVISELYRTRHGVEISYSLQSSFGCVFTGIVDSLPDIIEINGKNNFPQPLDSSPQTMLYYSYQGESPMVTCHIEVLARGE